MANDTAGSPTIHLPWAGKQVRIENVDSFLSSLWTMSVDNMRTTANTNVRTSVLNLVICVPDVASARYVTTVLRDLASSNLARATIVILDDNAQAPDKLDSWATLRCFPTTSDVTRHCFEQTTILTSGRAVRALPNTLPSMLKAHLPVYLWWIGDHKRVDATIFHRIAEMSQRVIVDSATFFQQEQGIHGMASYCQTVPTVAVSDLSWGRLTLWRQLLVQFFDIPEYLPFLTGIKKIEIEHVTAPQNAQQSKIQAQGEISPNPTSALLLAGWLKARLNLLQVDEDTQQRDVSSGTYQWQLKKSSGNQEALLQIKPHMQTDLQPGTIFLIRLTCFSGEKQATFTIRRDTNINHVLTSVEADQDTRPMRMVNLPARHRVSDLLRNELEITIHDQLFEQALQEVDQLLTDKEK
jgi:glucose-6-phosphate dehydrogenase assembly protein OpcA